MSGPRRPAVDQAERRRDGDAPEREDRSRRGSATRTPRNSATERHDERSGEPSAPTPVLFDMDGVLLNGRATPPGVYADAADAAIAAFGCDVDDRRRRVLRTHPPADAFRSVCRSLDVDPDQFWQRREREASRASEERIRAGERTLHEDVSAALEIARERPAGVVSNNRHETVRFVAAYFELDAALDVVRGRDPTLDGFDRRKPNPDYLSEAMAELGIEAGLYVGDRPKDVVAATRAGLDAALLRRPHHPATSADVTPADEIESLHELARLLDARERPDR